MRIVIGGAYNGKRDYVKRELLGPEQFQWFEGELPTGSAGKIVVTDLDQWLRQFEGDENTAIQVVMEALKDKESIVILTDISRGIVPMDPKDRELRDRAGRLYQRLIVEADEVIQIWYGIPKKIKERVL